MFNEITLLLFCTEIYHPWLNIDLACRSLQSPVSIFQGQIKEIDLHLLMELWLQQEKETSWRKKKEALMEFNI